LTLQHVQRILIVRFTSLGDVLLTTPLVRAIKVLHPHIIIDFCILDDLAQVVEHNPYIDNTILYSKDDLRLPSFQKQIKSGKYDLILDLQNNLRSSKLLSPFSTKVRRFKKYSLRKWLLVNFKINLMRDLPQISLRYAQVVPELVLDKKGLDLFLPDNIESELKSGLQYIGFCPGARHYTKMWPYDYYTELGEILFLHKYKVVLLGGKSDKAICDLIAVNLPDAINLCNDDELYKTAINMKQCKAIICNDSGLMHVASAVGVPLISIFGSTVTEFGFAPYNAKSQVMQIDNLECRPCTHIGRDTCPKKNFQCMLRITPATIFQQLNHLLVS
jgi:lipopolysaccharide heptosyltransferase II